MSTPRRQHGFTLVELLVVISIVALLVAILLPSLAAARMTATRVLCLNNQRQTFVALTSYATDDGDYPKTMSREYVEANVASLSGGEVAGFGITWDPFSTPPNNPIGPFVELGKNGYITYSALQCTVRPSFTLAVPRRGYTVSYPEITSLKDFAPGFWFDYNGPIVRGGTACDYGQNNLFAWLGGAWSDGYGNNNTWGLSFRDNGRHDSGGNLCRPGLRNVADIALLNCISIGTNDGIYGHPYLGEFEPHDEMPDSCVSPYPGFQGGGAANMPVRRNYLFGDGHGVYISRPRRDFGPSDTF